MIQTAVPMGPVSTRSAARAGRATEHDVHRPSPFLDLARRAGNQAVSRLVSRARLQPKLVVNAPGDAYEREADRVADSVMRMPEPGAAPALSETQPAVQRCACGGSCASCQQGENEEEDRLLHRSATGSEAPAVAPPVVHEVLRRPGEPLDGATRSFMEPRLGAELDGVRVHRDGLAAESARAVGALAYTVGDQVVFGAGQFLPHTAPGRRLLAHELTHVLQQRGAHVLQRQAEQKDTEETGGTRAAVLGPAPPFGDTAPDPACPRTPTFLSRAPPEPPCPPATEPIDGDEFTFCLGSDVLSPPAQRAAVAALARNASAHAHFTVQGYASRGEATVQGNLNLACHRAKRIARELMNAGVRSEVLTLSAFGETERFSQRVKDPKRRDRARDRTVVVRVDEAPITPAQLGPVPKDPQRLIRLVRDWIESRSYRLAADAYIARWTCGRTPSIADAVRRITIVRVAEVDILASNIQSRLGVPEMEAGLREVTLSQAAFETEDPFACVAARLVDSAFHLAVRETIPGSVAERHQAGQFLVELAGIPPCATPPEIAPDNPSLVLTPRDQWWTRLVADPRAARPLPPCADPALQGPIQPQPGPERPVAPPAFALAPNGFDIIGRRGDARWRVHPEADVSPINNLAILEPVGLGFEGTASVVAAGDPAEIAQYEVGFVQTIIRDQEVIDYVSGEQAVQVLPVPIRDGPPRDLFPAPWFHQPRVRSLQPGASVTTAMRDAPSMSMPYHFMPPERFGRAPTKPPLTPAQRLSWEVDWGNVVNHARRHTTFNTWVVVRRRNAPLDRFSTRFLAGRTIEWTMEVDPFGRDGAGEFEAAVTPGNPASTDPMQLAGPTPAELGVTPSLPSGPSGRDILRTRRFLEVVPPAGRGPGGLVLSVGSPNSFHKFVEDQARPLEDLRRLLGLEQNLTVKLRFNRETGRLIPDTEAHPAVVIETPDDSGIGPRRRAVFARALAARLRKDFVLAPPASPREDVTGVATVLSAIPRGAGHRQLPSEDLLGPRGGSGAIGALGQIQEELEGRARLEAAPRIFDPELLPEVRVRPLEEFYGYDFRFPVINFEQACYPPDLATDGCVQPFTPDATPPKNLVTVDIVPQTLNGELVLSPIEVTVRTMARGYWLRLPRERLDRDTMNHELHHLLDSYMLVQLFKSRLARAISVRLREFRRQAAAHPDFRSHLLDERTVRMIAIEEENRYTAAFAPEYYRLSEQVHSVKRLPWLTEQGIRRFWPEFRMPALTPDAVGSFTP